MARTAFVTGAASGIGEGIAERLAGDGFDIVIADIDDAGAAKVAERVGGRAVHCDVSDMDSVGEALTGPVDVLVNNAGFDSPGFFLQTDPASWERLIAVNLMGVLNCTYVAAPLLAERARETGYARIINIASDAGRVGSLGEAVYSAAKGGVIAFTKSMARELARDKITANAVCPGPADTPMSRAIQELDIGKKVFSKMVEATPLKRLASIEDIAGLVSYFAREESGFLTAQVVSVSGGLTIPA